MREGKGREVGTGSVIMQMRNKVFILLCNYVNEDGLQWFFFKDYILKTARAVARVEPSVVFSKTR